jgi:hypothetical protein
MRRVHKAAGRDVEVVDLRGSILDRQQKDGFLARRRPESLRDDIHLQPGRPAGAAQGRLPGVAVMSRSCDGSMLAVGD